MKGALVRVSVTVCFVLNLISYFLSSAVPYPNQLILPSESHQNNPENINSSQDIQNIQNIFPRSMITGLEGLTVSAGYSHSCAILADHTAMCWGNNWYGQLGNGTNNSQGVPVLVSGLTGVKAIVTGQGHSCALLIEGSVKCWGTNMFGELGDSTWDNKSTPVVVSGLSSGVLAISAGLDHTCVLMETGTVMCWGMNGSGELGDNTTVYRNTPVPVTGLTEKIKTIAAGAWHTCAVTVTNKVKCWGANSFGELGDGTTNERHSPVDVIGLDVDVLSIAGGEHHTCAVTELGGIKCWGRNINGELGDGTGIGQLLPIDVIDLHEKVMAVTAGGPSTCALTVSGRVLCWGWDGYGKLGDGTPYCKYVPTDVVGLNARILAISAGFYHICAVNEYGGIECWGDDSKGQLGIGATIESFKPVHSDIFEAGIVSVATGGDYDGGFTCVITAAGKVQCLGKSEYGELGDGLNSPSWTPVDVFGLDEKIIQIASGPDHSCALSESGWVKCWGGNDPYARLGDNSGDASWAPVDVVGLNGGVKSISVGDWSACALMDNGTVKCWGNNSSGQLGNGTDTATTIPVDVVGLTGAKAVAVGDDHACAITDGGGVKCWGSNIFGELGIGDGSLVEIFTPTNVDGLTKDVIAISAGGSHTCALLAGGTMKCWGNNYQGQDGDGTSENNQFSPVDVIGISEIRAIVAGPAFTCALTTSGQFSCWGASQFSVLGDETKSRHTTPIQITGLPADITEISVSESNICVLSATQGIYCWGDNSGRQLGDGFPLWRLTPWNVVGFVNHGSTVYLPSVMK